MPRSRSPMTSSSYRSYSPSTHIEREENGCRLYVADLSFKCTKNEIEKAFEKWPIIEIWHAQSSCFAFVVLRHRQDGQQAIKELDGGCIGDARVRVSLARPRTRRTHERRTFDPNMRCYQCGTRGHLSRDCGNNQQYFSHTRSRDFHRDRSHSRSRSRDNNTRRTTGYYTTF